MRTRNRFLDLQGVWLPAVLMVSVVPSSGNTLSNQSSSQIFVTLLAQIDNVDRRQPWPYPVDTGEIDRPSATGEFDFSATAAPPAE
jgi:hypothetical protein